MTPLEITHLNKTNRDREKCLSKGISNGVNNRGFTLVELLVAFTLFVLILGGVLGLVQTAARAQRETLERQAAIEEVSYVVDYISRAFRSAQKATDTSCVTAGAGWNFEITSSPTTLRFIDKDDRCREFIWEDEELKEQIDGGAFLNLTVSDDFAISILSFQERGAYQGTLASADYVEPHLTISFHVESKSSGKTLVNMQTTITQRRIDVRQ